MGEVILASTTDTQADIDAVVGIQPEEKPEVKENEPEKAEASGEGEAEEHKPTKSAVQKRIDKLTREKHEAQREKQELMDRLAKLEARFTEPAPKKEEKQEAAEEKGTPRPKEEDFKTWEEYQDALTDWKVEQRLEKKLAEKLAALEKTEAEEQAAKEQKAVWDAYDKREHAARERYEDYDEYAGRNIDIPQDIVPIILNHENGPDLRYYLGSHPEVAKKLVAMDPRLALVEVGKIMDKFADQEREEEADEEKPRSKAPAPIRPLGGSSTKSSVPADELPYQEFRRLREQQIKNRYKR